MSFYWPFVGFSNKHVFLKTVYMFFSYLLSYLSLSLRIDTLYFYRIIWYTKKMGTVHVISLLTRSQ